MNRPEQAMHGKVAVCRSLDEEEATLRGWGVPLRISQGGGEG